LTPLELPFFTQVVPVGSRVTCNPAPVDTDADFLCFFSDDADGHIPTRLLENGYEPHNADYPCDCRSWRKGEINLIITSSQDFFDKFMLGTRIAKRLNLLNKSDRVDVFKIIRGEIT
jgi:hypothetical protein